MSGAGPAEEIAAAEARLAELEERAASLAGVIAAATAAQVKVIAEVLEADLWAGWGITSPEHWVALRCGVSPSHARRLVAAARRLADLPRARAAFAAGEITEDHVGEIARAHVGSVHEDQAVDLHSGPDLDASTSRYEPRSGERADWRWFWWRDPWLPPVRPTASARGR